MKKKILYWLQHIDGIWSVPLAITLFWLIGLVMISVFGYATGTYDIGFIQPLFLASAVVIGATNAAVWGVFFTFRGLYRYLYGDKKKVPGVDLYKRVNYSKSDWTKLTAWQRYIVAFGVFFFFVSAILIVYLKLV